MSWEEISKETVICPCGMGSVTFTVEMDDWNRITKSRFLNCPSCEETEKAKARAYAAHTDLVNSFKAEAQQIAMERYLASWLELFTGKSKKACYEMLSAKGRWPSLGAFYRHVVDAGNMRAYLTQYFEAHIEDALQRTEITDKEILNLLEQSRQPFRYE